MDLTANMSCRQAYASAHCTVLSAIGLVELKVAHCCRPQEDVLLQHVSGEQLVFDAVVEGVLQLLQVGCLTSVCGQSF